MSRDTYKREGRGFTLTELLVVMAVLSTLMLLVLPAFTRGIVITRRVRCSGTLSHIGVAYAALLADVELNRAVHELQATGWARRLAPYLSYHRDGFWCTATGKSDGMGYDATDDDGVGSLPDVKIRIYDGGILYDVDTFTAYPYWLEGDHIAFGRTPGIWKVNSEVYGSVDRYNMPQYTPGPSRRDYWFIIEDQRVADDEGSPGTGAGDKDFNDFDLHVQEQSDGRVVLTGYHRAAGYTFALVGPDGTVYPEQSLTIGPVEVTGIDRLSYGMNSEIENLTRTSQSGDSIIVVDFKNEVVGTGRSIGLTDGWDILHAPRHMGQMNVLHADGHVGTRDPDEIDPEMSTGAEFWGSGP